MSEVSGKELSEDLLYDDMSIDEKIMLQGLKVPLDASHDSMFQNSTVSNPNVPYHIHVRFNIHVRYNVGRVKRGPEAPLDEIVHFSDL